ncbi:hypothetical protein TARUN_993 [Trichoderma arundinaceum]|uniref:DUF4048 domain-containing protein n=1 Tax=Trichoderma arundinaceum TaxID=490622 RepID=A0A395NYS7_TRIAR|nr:hypothetical protein TARUN_993 [Trichoderma arundinaceum]
MAASTRPKPAARPHSLSAEPLRTTSGPLEMRCCLGGFGGFGFQRASQLTPPPQGSPMMSDLVRVQPREVDVQIQAIIQQKPLARDERARPVPIFKLTYYTIPVLPACTCAYKAATPRRPLTSKSLACWLARSLAGRDNVAPPRERREEEKRISASTARANKTPPSSEDLEKSNAAPRTGRTWEGLRSRCYYERRERPIFLLLISIGCPMSGLHLGICIVDRSAHTLFDECQHLGQDHHRALLVRVAVVFVLLRRLRAPATHLHHKRHPVDGCHSLLVVLSLRARINLPRYLDMASQQQEIRLRSSAAERSPVTESVAATRARTATFASSSSSSPGISRSHSASSTSSTIDTADVMPPPPLPRSDSFTRGRSRASPSVSRHKNRLSLTLPVAVPLGDGPRLADSPSIMTASAVASSVPQTPLETPASLATSPSNANEFIIAIAAQERRVLELKEELAQAETELAMLKKQWASEEVYRKRSNSHRDLFGSSQASIDDDALVASRRSVELDRRKHILQGQTTPAQARRKVIRGGHARTLSLLSPVRTDSVFSLNEATQADTIALPSVEQRMAQLTNPTLSKRSSWQPRSQQSVASVVGVPSIVEDFKLGFRAFVEDIRQITVGDEPVTGQPQRPISTSIANAREQDTSKPNHATTHARTSSNEGSSTATSTSSQANRTPELKPKTGRGKQFSWTPLGFDSVDDTDWSNWDSPVSTKSARWSGSTINSSGIDDIPEKEDEEDAKPARKAETSLLSPTLEDLFPSVVHHLSPSNLKRTANNLMDEWERSLVAPESRSKGTTA